MYIGLLLEQIQGGPFYSAITICRKMNEMYTKNRKIKCNLINSGIFLQKYMRDKISKKIVGGIIISKQFFNAIKLRFILPEYILFSEGAVDFVLTLKKVINNLPLIFVHHGFRRDYWSISYYNSKVMKELIEYSKFIVTDPWDALLYIKRFGYEIFNKILLYPFFPYDDLLFPEPRKKIKLKKEDKKIITQLNATRKFSNLIIGHFGTLEELKGDHLVIQLIDKLMDKHKDISFVIGGNLNRASGRIIKLLIKLKKKYGKRIVFINNYKHELFPTILDNIDVLLELHPPYYQHFNLTLRESLASGKYMILSNIGVYNEILTKNKAKVAIVHQRESFKNEEINTSEMRDILNKIEGEIQYVYDNKNEIIKARKVNREIAKKLFSPEEVINWRLKTIEILLGAEHTIILDETTRLMYKYIEKFVNRL